MAEVQNIEECKWPEQARKIITSAKALFHAELSNIFDELGLVGELFQLFDCFKVHSSVPEPLTTVREMFESNMHNFASID